MPEGSLTRRANHRHIATIAEIIRPAPVSVAGFFVPASVQFGVDRQQTIALCLSYKDERRR
jgi:hypothetical protein